MIRKLVATTLAAAALSVSTLGVSTPVEASQFTPVRNSVCGLVNPPTLPSQWVFYQVHHRVNGGPWQTDGWFAVLGAAVWRYTHVGWQQVSSAWFHGAGPVGSHSTFEAWAWVSSDLRTGQWVNLGSCQIGGFVFTYG